MAATAKKPRLTLEIEAPANGRVGKSTVVARDGDGKTIHSDRADLNSAAERGKLAKRMAQKLDANEEEVAKDLDRVWNDALDERRRYREQAEAGSPEATPLVTAELLDDQAEAIRRPLCLIAGRSYAVVWCQNRITTVRSVDQATGRATEHNPPLVTTADCQVIVRNDGRLFSNDGLEGTAPLSEMEVLVELPHPIHPGRGWSGRGLKLYRSGKRPDPAAVFARMTQVADRFIDFDRCMAPQSTMCELVACYCLASWLLDAFHVIGYLWPNGEAGSGKTTFLTVVAELSYLGEVILASSSHAALRDLADYGALLAFDDAEAVMDVKRTDPDKRTLLLAGNRRGNCVALKEKAAGDRWVTRHVQTFCPRLFSAIRLPDAVLGSRSIVVHLVRSGDHQRTKANVLDYSAWPYDRRQLVDDCWALGLTYLPELPDHDARAAELARLTGRDLEPWRAILAVAHWLQEGHGVSGLFDRLKELSTTYQKNRQDFEHANPTRLLVWAVWELLGETEEITFTPAELADQMNAIATREDLAEEGDEFTNARKVGWLLKRLRFEKDERNNKAKRWKATGEEIAKLCDAYRVPRQESSDADIPF